MHRIADASSVVTAKAGDALHLQALKALKARSPLHFVTALQAGRLAYDVENDPDPDRARQDAQEDDGTRLTSEEAATFDLWANDGWGASLT